MFNTNPKPTPRTTTNKEATLVPAPPVKDDGVDTAGVVGVVSEVFTVNDTATPPAGAHNTWLSSKTTEKPVSAIFRL